MRHVKWNGFGYFSLIELARKKNVAPQTIDRWVKLGIDSDDKLQAYHTKVAPPNKVCQVCGSTIDGKRYRYCSAKCSKRAQYLASKRP